MNKPLLPYNIMFYASTNFFYIIYKRLGIKMELLTPFVGYGKHKFNNHFKKKFN